jgi:putative transposase
MKGRCHTPEQVVRKLREADRLLGEGTELPEVLKFLAGASALAQRRRHRGAARPHDGAQIEEPPGGVVCTSHDLSRREFIICPYGNS